MNQKLLLRRANQRLLVLRRLRQKERDGSEDASAALENFGEFYNQLVTRYVSDTSATVLELDESQTPILDALLGFVKWMYESGFLEALIGWFSGMAVSAQASGNSIDTAARDETIEFLATIETPE